MDTLNDVVLQADKSAFKAKKIGGPLPGNKLGAKNGRPGGLGLPLPQTLKRAVEKKLSGCVQ